MRRKSDEQTTIILIRIKHFHIISVKVSLNS